MKVFFVLASLVWKWSGGLSSFREDLNAIGARAVFPGDSAYSGLSEACKRTIFTKNGG